MSFPGGSIVTSNFTNSLASEFPNSLRSYKIESGISHRSTTDYLPINAVITGSDIENNYLEFIISPSDKEFINLENIFLELKLKVTRSNGSDMNDTDNCSIIDGVGSTIISSMNVFLNSQLIESCSYKGLNDYIHHTLNSSINEHKTIGVVNCFKGIDYEQKDHIVADNFGDNIHKSESDIIKRVRGGLHLMNRLKLDLATADFYLLDHLEMRIRLELKPSKYVLLTHSDTQFKYSIQMAKLHVEKIIPHASSLISLNKSLIGNNRSIEYIMDRSIMKTCVFSSGTREMQLDNIFSGVIPNKFIFFFINQDAVNGNYKRSPLYLSNCNVTSIRLDLNGQTYRSITGSFPNNYSLFFLNTLQSLDSDGNLLTYENFAKGKSIFAFDLKSYRGNDNLPVDMKGNLRLSISTSEEMAENYIMYMIGATTGKVSINLERSVETSFLT